VRCQEADIAAAPLLVISMRERVVDFTKPFMTSRVAAIMKQRHATQFDIHSVRDLAHQSTVKYGVLSSSATQFLFRTSTLPHYEHMWSQMANNPDTSFVHMTSEGIERVVASDDQNPWAFLSDTVNLASAARNMSDLVVVTDPYNERYVSLALALGATPLLSRLNLGILMLSENDEINRLRIKWWNLQ